MSTPDEIRVNLRALVNNAEIRRDVMHNGRRHIVLPSYTLPDGVVMNGGLYPKEEIDAAYNSLEGTLAPLGHPQIDGKYVSASTPEAINAYHVGAFNRNVERRGNRVYAEKWLDVETAEATPGGRELLEAINAGQPIHTSTGIFMQRDFTANGEGYEWTARNMRIDHDAILINETGAATPEQGVGLMVNVAEAVRVNQGDRVLSRDSYGARSAALSQAIRERYAQGDRYAYVEDFDESTVVFVTDEGMRSVKYTRDADGVVTLGAERGEVVQRTEYLEKNSLLQKFAQWLGLNVDSEAPKPVVVNEDQDMTPEELKAALDAQAETLAANFKAVLDPLTDRLTAVEAGLQANAAAAETEQRAAVGAVLGKEVADGLTGNALAAAYKRCQSAAPLLPGFASNSAEDDILDKPAK